MAVTHDIQRVSLESGNSAQVIQREYLELAAENDGKRFLAFCELTPPRLSDECRTATNIRRESAVSFAQAFERL